MKVSKRIKRKLLRSKLVIPKVLFAAKEHQLVRDRILRLLKAILSFKVLNGGNVTIQYIEGMMIDCVFLNNNFMLTQKMDIIYYYIH